MTCTLGIVDGESVILGADSAIYRGVTSDSEAMRPARVIVADHLDKAEHLVSSSRTNLSTVSTGLNETFNVLPADGQPKFDWTAVQEANIGLIEFATQEAQLAAQIHRIAKVRVSEAQTRRNRIVSGLRRRHRGLRKAFEGTYTADSLPLVGLDAPPALGYKAVREQCRDVVVRMGNDELSEKLGEPVDEYSPLDLGKLAAGMQGELNVFETALDDLTNARTARDTALVAKKEAAGRLRGVYTNIARVQEGYCRLVGLDDLADRLRLTVPRSPSPQDPASEPPASEPPASEPPVSEPSAP